MHNDKQALGELRHAQPGLTIGVRKLIKRFGERHPLLFHLRNDEIAGAVQDAAQRRDLVRRQALADVGDNRNPARNSGFEGDRSS